ncbi:MAG: VWA domain-containing protein [Planctomycetaceae bacterium]
MVSYDTYHRIEHTLNVSGLPPVDISDNPLTNDYEAVNLLMATKQANHYYPSTNIGGGMQDAIALLDEHGRSGARPNIILMTDGNANVYESYSLPSGWADNFNGYDGPGSTYDIWSGGASSSVANARGFLIAEVIEAVGKGYTIHTIAVGVDADANLMKAIAYYAGGEFIHVSGGTSVEEMEGQMLAAFHKIAGLVPPAKLLGPE